MKIRPARAELFHADGRTERQTDKAKLIVDFRDFGNAPKKPAEFCLDNLHTHTRYGA